MAPPQGALLESARTPQLPFTWSIITELLQAFGRAQ